MTILRKYKRKSFHRRILVIFGLTLLTTALAGEIKTPIIDPMFDEEAMKQKIFRFKPGSQAIKLGIKPIDLSKLGSTLAK